MHPSFHRNNPTSHLACESERSLGTCPGPRTWGTDMPQSTNPFSIIRYFRGVLIKLAEVWRSNKKKCSLTPTGADHVDSSDWPWLSLTIFFLTCLYAFAFGRLCLNTGTPGLIMYPLIHSVIRFSKFPVFHAKQCLQRGHSTHGHEAGILHQSQAALATLDSAHLPTCSSLRGLPLAHLRSLVILLS